MSKDLALQQTEWDLHENQNNFVPLEFTEEIKPDLFGLEITKANEMVSGLSITLAEREVLKNAYIDVISLEIIPETLPTFKELRLKIVKNRTQGIEKWHKENKAFYLAGGRFVDAIKNKEVKVNEEMESKLMDAEKYFENLEKEKARLINLERIEKIRPYVENADKMTFQEFDDESFDDFLLGKKTRFENEQKEREAEALRIESEKKLDELARERQLQIAPYLQFTNGNLELRTMSHEDYIKLISDCQIAKKEYEKEQEKIRLENEKLKAEAEAKEKELVIEKEKAKAEADRVESENQAKLKAEREAKEKVEAELKAKKEAEIKAENERKEAEEKARKEAEKLAKAPVKKQLSVWVDSFEINRTYIETNNATAKDIISKFEAFKNWAKKEIENL